MKKYIYNNTKNVLLTAFMPKFLTKYLFLNLKRQENVNNNIK